RRRRSRGGGGRRRAPREGRRLRADSCGCPTPRQECWRHAALLPHRLRSAGILSAVPTPSKTALVTGAARGIGLAIASRLCADGVRVAVLDLDATATEAAARQVGGETLAIAADVTRSADVDAAVQRVVDRWGRLDILVNNAGITGRSFPIWELNDDDWARVIDVDLTAVFYCCRAAVKAMLAQRSG